MWLHACMLSLAFIDWDLRPGCNNTLYMKFVTTLYYIIIDLILRAYACMVTIGLGLRVYTIEYSIPCMHAHNIKNLLLCYSMTLHDIVCSWSCEF